MSPPRLDRNLLLDYLVELGGALMAAGCPSHRLEELLGVVARLEGVTADVFAVPTGLFVSLRTPEGEPTAVAMVRVNEWRTDLGRLAALDRVLNDVAERTLSIAEARAALRALEAAPPAWRTWVRIAAGAGASAGAAVSFGGGLPDAALAGLGGLLLQVVITRARRAGMRFLEHFIGGVVAAVLSLLATAVWPTHSREVLVLSIIIPLLPGMVLTTGLAELTYKNLVAGTAHLMEAAVTMLSLVFGIALVLGVERELGLHADAAATSEAMAWPWQLLALVVALPSFGVLVGLPRRLLPVALAAGAVVWVMAALTRPWPGPHAAFAAAAVLGAASSLYARATQRPAQLFLVPGLLLLVPGVFGFRSLEALLRGDYAGGAGQLVDMFLIAGALVMGLLVASVAVPARKIL